MNVHEVRVCKSQLSVRVGIPTVGNGCLWRMVLNPPDAWILAFLPQCWVKAVSGGCKKALRS